MICRLVGHKLFNSSSSWLTAMLTGSRWVYGPYEHCLRCGKKVW
jgi:hypothetical protein